MANTGKQRSLTVEINKTVAGEQSKGYPVIYDGRLDFSHNGVNYPAIDQLALGTMPINQYTARLNAFKAYVQSLEQGLNFDTDTDPEAEAYRVNLTSCPI